MINVVGIKFFDGDRIYYFSPNGFEVHLGDFVIVETERGLQFGEAVTDAQSVSKEKVFFPLKDIIRIATEEDKLKNKKNNIDSQKALEYAKKLVIDNDLEMKIFNASYNFDKKKLVFKFIADERIDFRELAKELASKYKTRIELRQIGVRDKAKEIGGLGPCGRPLCCTEFLNNFDSVSINMAKNQGLALNPTKINGSCGRLLCCLAYEDEVYLNYKKGLPKIGELKKVNGQEGRVCDVDVLNRTYKLKINDSDIIDVKVDINERN